MKNPVDYEEFEELSEIVKVVELWRGLEPIRIEAKHDLKSAVTPSYSATVYRLKEAVLAPQGEARSPFRLWVVQDNFPRSYGNTADDAISMAMSFLLDSLALE